VDSTTEPNKLTSGSAIRAKPVIKLERWFVLLCLTVSSCWPNGSIWEEL